MFTDFQLINGWAGCLGFLEGLLSSNSEVNQHLAQLSVIFIEKAFQIIEWLTSEKGKQQELTKLRKFIGS